MLKDLIVDIEDFSVQLIIHNILPKYKSKNFILLSSLVILQSANKYVNEIQKGLYEIIRWDLALAEGCKFPCVGLQGHQLTVGI